MAETSLKPGLKKLGDAGVESTLLLALKNAEVDISSKAEADNLIQGFIHDWSGHPQTDVREAAQNLADKWKSEGGVVHGELTKIPAMTPEKREMIEELKADAYAKAQEKLRERREKDGIPERKAQEPDIALAQEEINELEQKAAERGDIHKKTGLTGPALVAEFRRREINKHVSEPIQPIAPVTEIAAAEKPEEKETAEEAAQEEDIMVFKKEEVYIEDALATLKGYSELKSQYREALSAYRREVGKLEKGREVDWAHAGETAKELVRLSEEIGNNVKSHSAELKGMVSEEMYAEAFANEKERMIESEKMLAMAAQKGAPEAVAEVEVAQKEETTKKPGMYTVEEVYPKEKEPAEKPAPEVALANRIRKLQKKELEERGLTEAPPTVVEAATQAPVAAAKEELELSPQERARRAQNWLDKIHENVGTRPDALKDPSAMAKWITAMYKYAKKEEREKEGKIVNKYDKALKVIARAEKEAKPIPVEEERRVVEPKKEEEFARKEPEKTPAEVAAVEQIEPIVPEEAIPPAPVVAAVEEKAPIKPEPMEKETPKSTVTVAPKTKKDDARRDVAALMTRMGPKEIGSLVGATRTSEKVKAPGSGPIEIIRLTRDQQYILKNGTSREKNELKGIFFTQLGKERKKRETFEQRGDNDGVKNTEETIDALEELIKRLS